MFSRQQENSQQQYDSLILRRENHWSGSVCITLGCIICCSLAVGGYIKYVHPNIFDGSVLIIGSITTIGLIASTVMFALFEYKQRAKKSVGNLPLRMKISSGFRTAFQVGFIVFLAPTCVLIIRQAVTHDKPTLFGIDILAISSVVATIFFCLYILCYIINKVQNTKQKQQITNPWISYFMKISLRNALDKIESINSRGYQLFLDKPSDINRINSHGDKLSTNTDSESTKEDKLCSKSHQIKNLMTLLRDSISKNPKLIFDYNDYYLRERVLEARIELFKLAEIALDRRFFYGHVDLTTLALQQEIKTLIDDKNLTEYERAQLDYISSLESELASMQAIVNDAASMQSKLLGIEEDIHEPEGFRLKTTVYHVINNSIEQAIEHCKAQKDRAAQHCTTQDISENNEGNLALDHNSESEYAELISNIYDLDAEIRGMCDDITTFTRSIFNAQKEAQKTLKFRPQVLPETPLAMPSIVCDDERPETPLAILSEVYDGERPETNITQSLRRIIESADRVCNIHDEQLNHKDPKQQELCDIIAGRAYNFCMEVGNQQKRQYGCSRHYSHIYEYCEYHLHMLRAANRSLLITHRRISKLVQHETLQRRGITQKYRECSQLLSKLEEKLMESTKIEGGEIVVVDPDLSNFSQMLAGTQKQVQKLSEIYQEACEEELESIQKKEEKVKSDQNTSTSLETKRQLLSEQQQKLETRELRTELAATFHNTMITLSSATEQIQYVNSIGKGPNSNTNGCSVSRALGDVACGHTTQVG